MSQRSKNGVEEPSTINLEEKGFQLDSTALAVLHTKENRAFLEFLLLEYTVYVSILSVYEYASSVYFHQRVDVNKVVSNLSKIYHVLSVDNDVIVKAALLDGELSRRRIFLNQIDLLVAATAMTHNLTLVTVDPRLYNGLPSYGLNLVSTEELTEVLSKKLEKLKP